MRLDVGRLAEGDVRLADGVFHFWGETRARSHGTPRQEISVMGRKRTFERRQKGRARCGVHSVNALNCQDRALVYRFERVEVRSDRDAIAWILPGNVALD